MPIMNSSQIHTPNIQTSLEEVNLLKLIDSGAIHFIGSRPLEAAGEREVSSMVLDVRK